MGNLFEAENRLPTLGILLVVTIVAAESIAVATAMPTAVRAVHGLRLYGWAFTGFLIPMVVGNVTGGAGPTARVRRRRSWPRSGSSPSAWRRAGAVGRPTAAIAQRRTGGYRVCCSPAPRWAGCCLWERCGCGCGRGCRRRGAGRRRLRDSRCGRGGIGATAVADRGTAGTTVALVDLGLAAVAALGALAAAPGSRLTAPGPRLTTAPGPARG